MTTVESILTPDQSGCPSVDYYQSLKKKSIARTSVALELTAKKVKDPNFDSEVLRYKEVARKLLIPEARTPPPRKAPSLEEVRVAALTSWRKATLIRVSPIARKVCPCNLLTVISSPSVRSTSTIGTPVISPATALVLAKYRDSHAVSDSPFAYQAAQEAVQRAPVPAPAASE